MGLIINNLSEFERRAALELDKDEKRAPGGSEKVLEKYASRFKKVSRSWLEKWAKYYTPAKLLSLVCNVISGLGVFFLVSMAFESLPGAYTRYIMASAGLFGFEWLKREVSDAFWDDYWSSGRVINWLWLGVNCLLLVISLSASLFGVYYLVRETDAGAASMDYQSKPEAAALVESINRKETEIADIKTEMKADRDNPSNYNSAGTYFWPMQEKEAISQSRIAALTTAISAAENRLDKEFTIVNFRNETIVKEWQQRLAVKVAFVLVATLLLEFVFEICMGFLSRYDFKQFELMTRLKERSGGIPHP